MGHAWAENGLRGGDLQASITAMRLVAGSGDHLVAVWGAAASSTHASFMSGMARALAMHAGFKRHY